MILLHLKIVSIRSMVYTLPCGNIMLYRTRDGTVIINCVVLLASISFSLALFTLALCGKEMPSSWQKAFHNSMYIYKSASIIHNHYYYYST